MAIRIVRLGAPRSKDEGTRIGAVRLPPRGVPKLRYASDDWFDVWLPDLSPSLMLMKQARAAETQKDWAVFVRRFRKEMNAAGPSHVLDLLSALSRHANLSLGCYCADESRCHRSVLRALLEERGADLV
jgi:uncharacterized protein YeaO (DUF488 family)